MTAAKVQSEALAITGKAAVLPNGCREVDTEFKCNRCADVSEAPCCPEPGLACSGCAACGHTSADETPFNRLLNPTADLQPD